MIALVKFVHIFAIAVWVGGLIALPTFHRYISCHPSGVPIVARDDTKFHAMKFAYVAIISPAAFVAVGSGIILVFQGTVVAPWFAVKLAFVAGLVVAHSIAGLTIAKLSEKNGQYPPWRSLAATLACSVFAVSIVSLTLLKPQLSGAALPSALSEPGALKSLVESINPWQRP